MSSLPITTLTASLHGLLLILLSVNVVRLRRSSRIGIGYGDDARLERACRMQGNFTEYVPLGLILIAALELSGASIWLLVSSAAALFCGRCLHAWGLYKTSGSSDQRVFGMLLTWLSIITSSIAGLVITFG